MKNFVTLISQKNPYFTNFIEGITLEDIVGLTQMTKSLNRELPSRKYSIKTLPASMKQVNDCVEKKRTRPETYSI